MVKSMEPVKYVVGTEGFGKISQKVNYTNAAIAMGMAKSMGLVKYVMVLE